ncbi:MAG: MBL fold metallo-hydrolase [Spirochaetales bacterium]|jgi:ribonuclease BN (tRNA processing enzyme)|nr:MBL fold metallo-hydrolase [Spirochaetales bacterium]
MTVRKFKKSPLPLTNSGKLCLFFVGVGSAFSKSHFQTNLLIIKGDDHVMIDCGTKAPQALFELGLSVTSIQNWLITHSHADHIGGLEEVMLMGRYVTRSKPTIIINPTYQNLLWDMSLRGGSAYNEERAGNILTFGDMWNIIRPEWLSEYPRETHEANIGSINLKMFRTMHIPEQPDSWQSSFWSCGVIVDDRIMFTADTRYDRDLLESFDKRFNFEVIFHDCQFFDGGVHAGIDQLSDLPGDMKKKMILTHYGDNWEENVPKMKKNGFAGFAKQWHYYTF